MPTGFHRPASVPEALELNATLGEATYFLAGGTELNQKHCPAQPQHLVSLEDLGLGGIAAAIGHEAIAIGIGAERLEPWFELAGVFRLLDTLPLNLKQAGRGR